MGPLTMGHLPEVVFREVDRNSHGVWESAQIIRQHIPWKLELLETNGGGSSTVEVTEARQD